ncbi:MAG TPA: hypothetical protein VF941_10895 [Clostridia bacterium]
MEYLTEEEQYKYALSNEEIHRIKNPELREIRWKYWRKIADVFLDESRIPDQEANRITLELIAAEKKEIEEFKQRMKEIQG